MPDDRRQDGKSYPRATPTDRAARSFVTTSENLDARHLATLTDAALSHAWNAGQTAVQNVLSAGVPAEDIADYYIPTIAREMGEQWCRDEMGFATVTIGTSRLQAMLRQLGPHWTGDNVANADAPTILVVVAEDIYHTLGAMVLSGQLRRKGISVRLLLGATPPEVAAQTQLLRFDAVFLSASCGETLESLRKIVKSVSQNAAVPTPVVVGGTILTEAPDAQPLTGADYATNDLNEALALCGLTETLKPAQARQGG